jgi:hypothetical protein
MSVRDYANALLLSSWALRKRRVRFDDSEVTIDWWAHLHPSARPRISALLACSAAKEFDDERVSTALRLADPERDGCWAQHLDR